MSFGLKDIADKLNDIPPGIAGAMLAMFLAFLRVTSDERDARPTRVALESLICGALSLTASSGILAMGLNMYWATFVGGAIGYFGSTSVRNLALKFLHKKI